MTMLSKLALAALALPAVLAASAADWRSRSIYQVLTDRFNRPDNSTSASCNTADYCGGTWQGIINRLDYIQNMGFTAVWISPVTSQALYELKTIDGNSYHGYWQNDLYGLNYKFGTADDLKKLSAELHKRGMYLMVDIVVNHFAWQGAASTVDYSTYNPFNNQKYFHPFCQLNNYNDPTQLKQCWMGSSNVELPDVNTTRSDVRSMYQDWIKYLVTTYSIDGLRIDTCLEVETDFFKDFQTAANVYIACEVDHGNPTVVEPYQQVVDGTLNYPLYFPVVQAFNGTTGAAGISNLVNNVNTIKNGFKDSTLLAPFTENHDNPRFPSYTSDMTLAENAIAFGMLADGPPIIYQGQEQHFSGGSVPNNREALWTSQFKTNAQLYKFISQVNQIRNHAVYVDPTYLTYKAYPIYSDASTIAMRKGFDGKAIIAVFSNRGSGGASYTVTVQSGGLSSGAKAVEVLTCATATADGNGNISVNIAGGAVRIFYPATVLSGTGICGY